VLRATADARSYFAEPSDEARWEAVREARRLLPLRRRRRRVRTLARGAARRPDQPRARTLLPWLAFMGARRRRGTAGCVRRGHARDPKPLGRGVPRVVPARLGPLREAIDRGERAAGICATTTTDCAPLCAAHARQAERRSQGAYLERFPLWAAVRVSTVQTPRRCLTALRCEATTREGE